MSLPPYRCHNRKPFKEVVVVRGPWNGGLVVFPFRMAMDCRYSLSDLGQIDARCDGCKWRQGTTGVGAAAQVPTESTNAFKV